MKDRENSLPRGRPPWVHTHNQQMLPGHLGNVFYSLDFSSSSPCYCKEIQPVHSEGDQPWDFSGRNDAKAETPVLWPPHVKSWLIGKDSDAGRDWGQEEKGTTEDEIGWMASLTRWTWVWVWVNSGSWWWTGRPGVGVMGSQRVGHDWATELNWTELSHCYFHSSLKLKNMILKMCQVFLVVEAVVTYHLISERRSKERYLALKILRSWS